MIERVELRCGRVLNLQAVNRATLRYILRDLLGYDLPDAGNWDVEHTEAFNKVTERLFNYCVGWGVTDNPTEAEVRELVKLKFLDDPTPNAARVAWVRYLLIDEDEAGPLIGFVMTLTFAGANEE